MSRTHTRMISILTLLSVFSLLLTGCGQGGMQTDPGKARIDARTTLRRSAESNDRFTRSMAIEAMVRAMGVKAAGRYMEALNDPQPYVRFAATLAIGDLRYQSALPKLKKMAQYKTASAEKDIRVYAGVLYALYRLGQTDRVGDLAKLLFHPEAEVRANTALVMGKMEESSAISPLQSQLGEEQDVSVRLQILESLALLGDERTMGKLEAYARNPYMLDNQLIAIETLGHTGGRRALMVLREILYSDRQPPRSRVSAAGGMARIGEVDDYGYDLCITSAWKPRQVLKEGVGEGHVPLQVDVNSLRRLAAVSLGWMDRPEAVDALHPLLDDNDGGVRVAAAMAILKLIPPSRESSDNPEVATTVEPTEEPVRDSVGRAPEPPVARQKVTAKKRTRKAAKAPQKDVTQTRTRAVSDQSVWRPGMDVARQEGIRARNKRPAKQTVTSVSEKTSAPGTAKKTEKPAASEKAKPARVDSSKKTAKRAVATSQKPTQPTPLKEEPVTKPVQKEPESQPSTQPSSKPAEGDELPEFLPETEPERIKLYKSPWKE